VARVRITPDLASIVSFEHAGVRLPVRMRRRGAGRRQQLRRMAGEVTREEVWNLRDASFTLAEGEALAIVGHRESGRDPLLRLAAGTLVPDEGTVQRRVPVVPVIGVGRALGRNYTVRQNIYLVGGLLGMTPEMVAERLPQIIKDAGLDGMVDKYLGDTPGRVRGPLAWTIAMATEGRAFAISEAMVVGDPAYQERCWKIIEAKRADGVSFLVTSEREAHLLRFCERALLLDEDRIIDDTTVESALEQLHHLKRHEHAAGLAQEELADEDDDELL
jgi:ABC-2 type transport system ATP-binding protein